MANSIGSLTFACFYGEPPAWQEQIERIAYPGADGARYRKTGKFGGPFTLQTCDFPATIAAGRTLMLSYAALVGTGSHQLVWRGRDFDDEDLKVVVLQVTQKELRAVGPHVFNSGGANSGARLRAEWVLDFKFV